MKRLNGWHRLWLVFCAVLGVLCAFVATRVHGDDRVLMLWIWLVPSVTLYVMGWAFVWIVRGFKGPGQ
ncbi:hypothetical protein BGP81_22400 [Pseudomonas putida]|nr:hypothetical protein BGP81_22400 [Pseudomonas putida]